MSYKIGSFNCLNFSRSSSKDVQVFADMILNERFDIIALQEIKGQTALDRILRMLPPYWKGIADDEVTDYAFIWNSMRMELAHTEVIDDLQGKHTRTYSPRIYKQYKIDRKNGQTDLKREPFFARFFPCGAAPFIEIRLINTHIRFTKENDSEIELPGAIAMRKNELDILAKAIYAKEADKRYGNNRPAYTILLGDYNLNLPSSAASSPYLAESYEIFDGNNSKIITTFQHELTTLSRPPEKEDDNELKKQIFANNYDHFTYDVSRFSGLVLSCGRVNTVEDYCNGDCQKHREEVSDHVPITMNIELK